MPEKLTTLLAKHQGQWYFIPSLGFVFLSIILTTVILISKLTTSSTRVTPSPSPQATFSPSPSTKPSPTPTTNPDAPTPTPTSTAKATPTPKPSITPTPSPTPEPAVRINKPEHRVNYEGNSIDIDITVISGKKVDKLELIINGEVKHSWTQEPYTTSLQNLNAGSYKLKGKAYLSGGDTLESGELLFGLGGTSWDATPTPEASPSSSPNTNQ